MKIIQFLFLCIVWGTTWLAIKISLEGIPPTLGAATRFSVAFVGLAIYALLRRTKLRVNKKEFWLLALTAFLVYALDYGMIYWAEQYISAGVAAIFFATFPLFTSIISNFIFKHEKFQWHQFVGLMVGFAGIVLVFYDQIAVTSFDRLVILGSLAVILGAASAALALIIVKVRLPKMDPVALTFHQTWMGVILLLMFGLVAEDIGSIQINLRVGSAVLYLGIIGSSVAFVIWYKLLQVLNSITLSLVIYITPIVALVCDYLVFGDIISIRSFIGVAITFIGIAITQRKERKS